MDISVRSPLGVDVWKNFCNGEVSKTSFEDIARGNSHRTPMHSCDQMSELVHQVEQGLATQEPELCDEGVGGTYFMKNTKGERVGVFKPMDEEASSPNNPKLHAQGGSDGDVKRGFEVGGGAVREVAAFLLDKDQFAGVPPTTLFTCSHAAFNNVSDLRKSQLKVKTGSLQKFEPHDCASWDVGSSQFPVNQVHRIGALDIRLLNADRHGGNILVRMPKNSKSMSQQTGYQLIPIDHGFCLPDRLEDDIWFEWLNWPQSKQPFDEETRRYIADLDVNEDASILISLGLSRSAILYFKAATLLLKKGVEAGLTLFEIGSMICHSSTMSDSSLFFSAVSSVKPNQTCGASSSTVASDEDLREEEKMRLQKLHVLFDEAITKVKAGPPKGKNKNPLNGELLYKHAFSK